MAETVVAVGAVIPVCPSYQGIKELIRSFDLSSNTMVVLAVWQPAGPHLSLDFCFLAKNHPTWIKD